MNISCLKKNPREALLLCGMGICALASALTAVNVIALPVARNYHDYSAWLALPVLVVFLAAMCLLKRKLHAAQEAQLCRAARISVPVFLGVLFCAHVLAGYALEYTPSGDNFMLYNAAQLLATDGHFDAYPDFYLYLSRFSNQWGFMLMLSALYKLLFAAGFADMFLPTVIVQAMLYAAGVGALFASARRLGGVRGVLSLLFALVFFFPLHIAAAVLYTDTFSMPFVALSLLFALRAAQGKTLRAQAVNALACAAFAAVGGQIKMTAAIVLIAAAIVFFLRMRPLRALALCAAMAAVMGGSVFAVRTAMVGPVLDPAMVSQHNTPTIHWIMMSIPNGNNPYGDDIEDYRQTWTMMENGASREEVMDSIYTRLIDKIYYLRYPSRLMTALINKNAVAFGDGTIGLSEILDDKPARHTVLSDIVLEGGRFYGVYSAVCSGIWGAHLVCALIACLRDIRKRDVSAALLYLCMLGIMLFMLIWEVRSRYIFNFAPVIVMISALCGIKGEREENAR